MNDTTLENSDRDPDYLDCLIREREAAKFLGYNARTLQNWRFRGCGPKFVRVSSRSIRYRRRDLIVWAEERLVYNTSEPETSEFEYVVSICEES